MAFLIDGYNLLHVLGTVSKKAAPGELERARLELLKLLHSHFREQAATVTVVFDSAKAPRGSTPEQDYEGVHVVFAEAGLQADDVIEKFIQREQLPESLVGMSNDH